jgi:hypothetical protein
MTLVVRMWTMRTWAATTIRVRTTRARVMVVWSTTTTLPSRLIGAR